MENIGVAFYNKDELKEKFDSLGKDTIWKMIEEKKDLELWEQAKDFLGYSVIPENDRIIVFETILDVFRDRGGLFNKEGGKVRSVSDNISKRFEKKAQRIVESRWFKYNMQKGQEEYLKEIGDDAVFDLIFVKKENGWRIFYGYN